MLSGEAGERAQQRPLRERQKDYTRGAIMSALAEVIAERGVHAFTVQEVADRAGVSHRTVYRHFPTREALLADLSEWLEEQTRRRGAPGVPSSAEEVAESVEFIYRLFDEYEPLVRALAITYTVSNVSSPAREERTRGFERMFREAVPGATEEEVRALFAVSRALSSTQAWLFFRDHLGLTGGDAGQAVQWAIQTLLSAVKERSEAPSGTKEGE